MDKRIRQVVGSVFVLIWFCLICSRTDSYWINYLICAIFSLVGVFFYDNKNRDHISSVIFGCLYSFCVTLSNYNYLKNIIWLTGILVTGFVTGYYMVCFFCKLYELNIKIENKNNKQLQVFIISFLLISAVNISYLLLCDYPGNISPDSLSQIKQVLTVSYSDHHPFWHTMIIKMCLDIGITLFKDINLGIALYSIFQIIYMSTCFSYAVTTVYSFSNRVFTILLMLIYCFMPYNIIYSITMWKDVMFSGSILLFVVSMYNVMKNKNSRINWLLLTIGFVGSSILRNNGWMALVATYLVFLIVLRKRYNLLKICLAILIVISFVIKGPLVKILGVKKTEFREALSIPIQQVSKVIYNKEAITAEQELMISKIVTVEEIRENYLPYISDPVKFRIDDEILKNDKMVYLKMWAEIGIKHPITYITAWIDQTRGYWNSGYKYWIWSLGVIDNSYGIESNVKSNRLRSITDTLLRIFDNSMILKPLVSIGFNVWVMIIMALVYISKKRYEEFVLTLPALFVIGTLLIATPVFSEFRYAYCIFTCLPFIMSVIHNKQFN